MSVTHSPVDALQAFLLARAKDEISLLPDLLAALQEGHVCLPIPPDADLPQEIVGQPGEFKPLIRDGDRLYLARHWQEETRVAASLLALAQQSFIPAPAAREALRRYFPEGETGQKKAVATALSGALTVIAGGPGTGKTTTVVRLLAVLAGTSPHPLKIRLAAPTGKAAQRMSESIRKQIPTLDLMAAAAIPQNAETLHRLLGYQPETGQVRHDAHHPLDLDVLVVDEASMIDLAMMARLLAALPKGARLILLGDPDQLAAVEAGSVFADLCALCTGPVAARVARLSESHRFADDGGIGVLAGLCNAGEVDAVLNVLGEGGEALHWQAEVDAATLLAACKTGFAAYRDAVRSHASPAAAFAAFQSFRVLCAQREGRTGLDELNRQIAQSLFAPRSEWYEGRPVMVSRNDYAQRLFNGDIGLFLNGQVWFESNESGMRSLVPALLPAHETAFAMTVHKSQGSEFAEILLALPDAMSAVLDRNLVYTAVTRARKRVQVWAATAVLEQALQRRAHRFSGLAARLAA